MNTTNQRFILTASAPHQGKPTATVRAWDDVIADMAGWANLNPEAPDFPVTLPGIREWMEYDNRWGSAVVIPVDKPDTEDGFYDVANTANMAIPGTFRAVEKALAQFWGKRHTSYAWQLYEEEYPTESGGFILHSGDSLTLYGADGAEVDDDETGRDTWKLAADHLAERNNDAVVWPR